MWLFLPLTALPLSWPESQTPLFWRNPTNHTARALVIWDNTHLARFSRSARMYYVYSPKSPMDSRLFYNHSPHHRIRQIITWFYTASFFLHYTQTYLFSEMLFALHRNEVAFGALQKLTKIFLGTWILHLVLYKRHSCVRRAVDEWSLCSSFLHISWRWRVKNWQRVSEVRQRERKMQI